MSRRHQYIETMLPSRSFAALADDNAFELRTDRGWVWLQKLCFAVLKWIGAHRLMTVEKVTYGPLDAPKLIEKVFWSIENTVGWQSRRADEFCLVMGAKQFQELISHREVRDCFGWDLMVDVWTPYTKEIHGVPIAVVPWIDGLAVVPRCLLRSGSQRGF